MRKFFKALIVTGLLLSTAWVVLKSAPILDVFYTVKIVKQHPLQNTIKLKDGTLIEVHKEVAPFVEEFFNESYKRGVKVDSIFQKFGGMYVDKLPLGILGSTYFHSDRYFAVISPSLLNNHNRLRAVVFHELAHVYVGNRIDHCHNICTQIFSASSSTNYYGINWENQKDVLFYDLPHWGN